MANLHKIVIFGLASSLAVNCGQRAEITAKTSGTLPGTGDAVHAEPGDKIVLADEKNSANASVAESAQIETSAESTQADTSRPVGIDASATTQEFLSGTLIDIVNEFTVEHTTIMTKFVLLREILAVATESQFQQIVRTVNTQAFTQGHTGTESEVFTYASGVETKTLAKPADAGSVSVTADGVAWTDFTITNASTLTWTAEPADGASIIIKYTSAATPVVDTFQLASVSDMSTIKITVNSVAVAAGDYTVENGNSIKFNTKPADDSEIVVKYKEIVIMPKSFMVTPGAVTGSFKLFVDATERPGTYNSVTGEVRFAVAPEEGTTVKIKYQISVVGNPITKFPLITASGTVKKLAAVDTTTGENIDVSYAENLLTVDPKFFVNGREIAVSYLDESKNNLAYDLPMAPVPGSVLVVLLLNDASEKTPLPTNYAVNGMVVSLNGDLTETKKITIKYKSEVKSRDSFSMVGVNDPDKAKWTVWINGVLSLNYSREGDTININEALPPASKILIKAQMQ